MKFVFCNLFSLGYVGLLLWLRTKVIASTPPDKVYLILISHVSLALTYGT